ncbi:MAG: bifunctional ornithine acetyltransferase/N-acetylglutamate synthase, partial [Treponema sp.]|nr:bifunctional ornithine acetyltransferase/N-acetylglutamate synthase [Treponema sp.]
MKFIDGGVTAPIGFTANGIHSGLKESRKTNDTALIFSDTMCTAAGIFTQNRSQAECVKYTRKVVATGKAQAAVCNVCYANACTG